MSDFTMEVRLCDDTGMVSRQRVEPGAPGTIFDPDLTYLRRLNNMRARNRNPDARRPVAEPFACTGSAHLAGEHIRCTSPAHSRLDTAVAFGTAPMALGTAVGLLSPVGSRVVSANGYCHVCGDSLVRPDNTPDVLFCCSCRSERSYA